MSINRAIDKKYQQVQFESIVSSSLKQIENGELEELMTSLRQGWDIDKLFLLKKATDKKISKSENDYEETEDPDERLAIGKTISNMITLFIRILKVLNEKRAQNSDKKPNKV